MPGIDSARVDIGTDESFIKPRAWSICIENETLGVSANRYKIVRVYLRAQSLEFEIVAKAGYLRGTIIAPPLPCCTQKVIRDSKAAITLNHVE